MTSNTRVEDPLQPRNPIYGVVRKLVRGTYDLQKLRIQTGNRLVTAYKERLGIDTTQSEENADEKATAIILAIKRDYDRLTDGVAVSLDGTIKLPRYKTFKGGDVIKDYVDFALANQYFSLLRNEEQQFKILGNILEEVPLWTEFMAKIPGLGVQMAGVLISEIDIYKARYASSLWQLAGLSTTRIGFSVDAEGKEKRYSLATLAGVIDPNDPFKPVMYQGQMIHFKDVGTNKHDYCLVDRPYLDSEGQQKWKKSITYNPWLKTKLMGVLAGSFLKQTKTLVDGQQISAAERLGMAKSYGFKSSATGSALTQAINDCLQANGHQVERVLGHYAKIYYDARLRAENAVQWQNATPAHRHMHSLRVMMKSYLVDHYRMARELEGLPVYDGYAEAKLGIKHSKPTSPYDGLDATES